MKERTGESDSLSLASKWCWVHGLLSFLSLLVLLSLFLFFSTCPCFPSSDPSFLSSSLLALSFARLFLSRPSNHPSLLPSLFYFLCVILSASETCYILISMVTYCSRLSLLTHLKTNFTYCRDHFVVLVL